MNNKYYQVLLVFEKVLENETTGEVPCLRPTQHLLQVLRNFAEFIGKHLWQRLFLIKLWAEALLLIFPVSPLEDFSFISFQQKMK